MRRVSPLWTAAVAAILALVLLPVITIGVLALQPSPGVWSALAKSVLPSAMLNTLLLMTGVGLITLTIGIVTAWLVTVFRFPGRFAVTWLLLVPLAMPTYIIAYCYVDLLDYSGPVQSALRWLIGAHTSKDYWFPDIKSLPGAIFIMSSVLFPYVYMTARASFEQQSMSTLEVARTLGHTATGVLWRVALPMARPALVAGVALALMETLNDIGASEYLGVRTLTVTAYTTWLQRQSLSGAAQIAAVMLIVVLILFFIERLMRGERGYYDPAARFRPPPEIELDCWRGWGALAICLLPVVIGFVLPVSVLFVHVFENLGEVLDGEFWQAALSSLTVAAAAAVLTLAMAVILAYAQRVAPNGFTRPGVRLAGLGYAIPGTVLALGLLYPLAALDNAVDGLLRQWLGLSTGLILTGSVLALIIAYAIRFMAAALGAIEAGLTRISPNLDAAARTLGQTELGALRRVHLPLLRIPAIAALLLVFVDAMKELPATLLLRPFNYQSLATRVYELAALERFELAGIAALMIVLAGLVPIVLITWMLDGWRRGTRQSSWMAPAS